MACLQLGYESTECDHMTCLQHWYEGDEVDSLKSILVEVVWFTIGRCEDDDAVLP